MRMLPIVLTLASTAALGCGGAGASFSVEGPSARGDTWLTRDRASAAGSVEGGLRLHPDVCKDEPLRSDFGALNEDSFVAFLRAHRYEARKTRARNDLVYVDVVRGESVVRFRVAILGAPHEAGRELHQAMLEHGPGSWGVHRSNLAVLAPITPLSDALTMAIETKLACWGVLTYTGLDDTFVIPGGYTEL